MAELSPVATIREQPVVVQIVQQPAPRLFVSQRDHADFGFNSAEKFLAFLRRHGVPFTPAGALRLVAVEELVKAIKARARTAQRKPAAPGDSLDETAIARAGLRRQRRKP